MVGAFQTTPQQQKYVSFGDSFSRPDRVEDYRIEGYAAYESQEKM